MLVNKIVGKQHLHVVGKEENAMILFEDIGRDTISESLSDFLQRSQTPVEALWSLRSIDLRVIALLLSFVELRMLQNASLVSLISEPIRVKVFSFVVYKRGVRSIPNKIFLALKLPPPQDFLSPSVWCIQIKT